MGSATIQSAARLARDLQSQIDATIKPPSETAASAAEPIVYMAIVRGTRGYIEKLSHQINGTYASAWYDACAVMIRRLVETLIIEAFEAHQIQQRIKDSSGNYFFLRDLVDLAVAEPSWTLGRNAKKALAKLKDVGDKSAHSRRYVAHREDIDHVQGDLREVLQEFVYLAKFK